MNFSIFEESTWVVPASDLLSANPNAQMALAELAQRGGQKIVVHQASPNLWEIFSETPWRHGNSILSFQGPLSIPESASRKVAWPTVAVYSGIAGVVGWWLWSRRRRSTLTDLPSHLCCPSSSRKLSNGACQDLSTKKFVKMVPCVRMLPAHRIDTPARTLPAPRRVGLPEPFPRALYGLGNSRSDILPGNYWITIDGRVYNTQGPDREDMIGVVRDLHRKRVIMGGKRMMIKLYDSENNEVARYGPGPGDQFRWFR